MKSRRFTGNYKFRFVHFTVEMPVSYIGMAISRQPNAPIWLSGEMSGFKIWVWEFLARSW